MNVLTITNQKGGVGKTTLALHLATLAAMDRSVLLVDVDPQGNATAWTGGVPDSANIRHLFEGQDVTPVRLRGMDVLGADISLASAERRIAYADYYRLRRYLAADTHDLVIIDCPPTLGVFSTAALVAADWFLVPVDASRFAVLGLHDLFDTARDVRGSVEGSRLRCLGIVLHGISNRTKVAKQVQDTLRAEYDARLFTTVVPQATAVPLAITNGATVLQSDPDSKAAMAYRALWAECQERMT